MSAKFKLINQEDVPKDLPPGKYTTKVVRSVIEPGTAFTIELEYIGEKYNPDDPQCLFPMTKEDV